MKQERLGIFVEGMPLLEARKQAAELLNPVSGESAFFEAGQLLGKIVGIPGSQLGLYAHRGLSLQQAQQLIQWVRRRMEGEPLQYILGEWEGRLAVYRTGESEPDSVLDVYLGLLPPADAQALREGIPVEDQTELNRRLEDFMS